MRWDDTSRNETYASVGMSTPSKSTDRAPFIYIALCSMRVLSFPFRVDSPKSVRSLLTVRLLQRLLQSHEAITGMSWLLLCLTLVGRDRLLFYINSKLQDNKGVVSEEQAKLLLCRGGEKLNDEQCEDIFRLTGAKVRGGIDYRSKLFGCLQSISTYLNPRDFLNLVNNINWMTKCGNA